MTDKKKFEDDRPGMDQKREMKNEDYQQTKKSAATGEQGRAGFNPGSTTQGGSDYGQGSKALGGESYKQGAQKNDGANYADEAGKLSSVQSTDERAETEKQKVQEELKAKGEKAPHGEGANTNERERNAQEDYPGPAKKHLNDPPDVS